MKETGSSEGRDAKDDGALGHMRILPIYVMAEGDLVPDEFCLTGESAVGAQATLVIGTANGKKYAIKVYEDYRTARSEYECLEAAKEFNAVPLAYRFGEVQVPGEDPAPQQEKRWAVVMEHVEGETLEAHLRRSSRKSVEHWLLAFGDFVRFLSFIEDGQIRSAIRHNDLKPANIIVQPDGGLKLIDFRLADKGEPSAPRGGTPGFAPPEVLFADSREAHAGCDAFALAATMVTCLAGRAAAPAYGVTYREQDGEPRRKGRPLAYAAAWTDDVELGKAGKCGFDTAPGAYPRRLDGSYLKESELNGWLHDEQIRGKVRDALVAKIVEVYGQQPRSDKVEAALDETALALDERVAVCLAACLSDDAAKRPSITQLESALPFAEDRLLRELELTAENAYLKGNLTTFAADPRSSNLEMGFLQAYNLYNMGKYNECLPVFERLALSGDPSAKYQLAVMIRDGYGYAQDRYGSEDVATLMADSAEAGIVLAMNWFGHMLYDGDGIERNRELGIAWVRRAAEGNPDEGVQGFLVAQNWLKGVGCE